MVFESWEKQIGMVVLPGNVEKNSELAFLCIDFFVRQLGSTLPKNRKTTL